MAPATASGASGGSGENTGRWTADEHRLFLQGLEQHGKGWKKIASLIKSRTVVQIRTHAQKYFQKLAKARQNGEDGDVSMDARGGPTSIMLGDYSTASTGTKRRRQTTGTKRKAISSVVASAQREGKKLQEAQIASGVPCPVPPLPSVAPALAPFLVPAAQPVPNSAHSAISTPALEDSLYVLVALSCSSPSFNQLTNHLLLSIASAS
jgi:SHAQKYF class myb-like DNA-binding protein